MCRRRKWRRCACVMQVRLLFACSGRVLRWAFAVCPSTRSRTDIRCIDSSPTSRTWSARVCLLLQRISTSRKSSKRHRYGGGSRENHCDDVLNLVSLCSCVVCALLTSVQAAVCCQCSAQEGLWSTVMCPLAYLRNHIVTNFFLCVLVLPVSVARSVDTWCILPVFRMTWFHTIGSMAHLV